MSIKNVSDDEFDATVLQSSKPVVVDFWAEWCAPCKLIAPVLEEVDNELGEKIDIAKVNIDDNPQVPSTYGVRGIPTLMMFKDSELVSSRVGALSKAQLSEWINENL